MKYIPPEKLSSVYNDTIDFLYNLSKKGIKLGLQNITTLLRAMGNPQREFRTVHIAGTNGKGFTSHTLATLLSAMGYRTGLFTSPHMVRFTERIVVDGVEIGESEVVEITDRIKRLIERESIPLPTFFEMVTAVAFEYFRLRSVQWAVVETGMGGRFDATNTITPEVSIITRIGMDHKEFLGDTIESIANEKAGIIKTCVPVVVASQVPEAMRVVKEKARQMDAPVYVYGEDFRAEVTSQDIEGIEFDFYSSLLSSPIASLKIPVTGRHQTMNASLAIQAMLLLMEDRGVAPESIRDALRRLSCRGRTELVRFHNRWFLLDGAHNPDASQALADTINQLYRKRFKRVFVLVGVMADKDIEGILRPFCACADMLVLTRASYERSAETEHLQRCLPQQVRYISTTGVKEAIERVLSLVSEDDLTVVTGSFYIVGEFKELMGETEVLTGLRETV